MAYTKILYTLSDNVAEIILNAPKALNAFDENMSDDLLAALGQSAQDPSVKAICIRANGKAFSGGGDIVEMADNAQAGKVIFDVTARKVAQISLAIKRINKPVVMAAHGAVAGAAFNMALACDFCFASDNAKFIQAFVNIALIPDAGGLFLLSRAVGVNKAMQLCMTGAIVGAQEGQQLGFVYKVCCGEELNQQSLEFAKHLAKGPGKAYALMKELMYQSQFKDFEEYIEHEIQAQFACGFTADFKEGITAFLEKRKPNFIGG